MMRPQASFDPLCGLPELSDSLGRLLAADDADFPLGGATFLNIIPAKARP